MNTNGSVKRQRRLQYRGRVEQVPIYLGKFLRMFIYQADWKVLPMSALIAYIVSMVVRKDFFVTMEGGVKGALALTCLAIWNGCFNSIQVVCREREIVKREHRAGMHVTSYVFSHMLYQGLLCLGQSVLTIYVCKFSGIKFPDKGLITPWCMLDIGITVFLMTYASDMLSLWISCMVRSTTTAMTVMPFILIFQLVFSGGMFNLPEWTKNFSSLSISNYGLRCIMAQSNYNNLPLASAWNSIEKVENQEISTTVTLGQVMDFLTDETKEISRDIRSKEVQVMSSEELSDLVRTVLVESSVTGGIPTLDELLDTIDKAIKTDKAHAEDPKQTVTLGEVIDKVAELQYTQEHRDTSFTFSTTVGKMLDAVGRDKTKAYVEELTAQANKKAEYAYTQDNVIDYWVEISKFIVIFAVLAVIFLEFVDKDKR